MSESNDSPSPLLNGLRVLETFSVEEPLQGVSEIARKVDLHKSSVSRILSTLQKAGYVDRDPDSGRYLLGTGLLGLAGPLLAVLDVRRVSYPILEQLARKTGETAALTVWNGHETVIVEQVPSPHQVKHTASLGTRYETLASASVQVFLADLPAEDARTVVESPRAEDGWQVGTEDYLRSLDIVRSRGYAVNYGNTSPEEMGVAAPVWDHRGVLVAAVMLSAPKFRIDPEQVHKLALDVTEAGLNISARLGYTAAA